MDVRCERCKAEYEFDERRIGESGVAVKCATCGHIFMVRKPIRAAPGPTSERTRDWKMRQPSGKVYAFKDLATLQRWIGERKATREDELSVDGSPWRKLGAIPELAPFFASMAPARPANGAVATPPRPTNEVTQARQPAPQAQFGETASIPLPPPSGPASMPHHTPETSSGAIALPAPDASSSEVALPAPGTFSSAAIPLPPPSAAELGAAAQSSPSGLAETLFDSGAGDSIPLPGASSAALVDDLSDLTAPALGGPAPDEVGAELDGTDALVALPPPSAPPSVASLSETAHQKAVAAEIMNFPPRRLTPGGTPVIAETAAPEASPSKAESAPVAAPVPAPASTPAPAAIAGKAPPKMTAKVETAARRGGFGMMGWAAVAAGALVLGGGAAFYLREGGTSQPPVPSEIHTAHPAQVAQAKDTAKPAGTAKASDTAKPSEVAKTADAARLTEVAKASGTAKGSDTAKPSEVAKAKDAAEPTGAAEPKPTETAQANATAEPLKVAQVATVGTPTESAKPNEPAPPTQTAKPSEVATAADVTKAADTAKSTDTAHPVEVAKATVTPTTAQPAKAVEPAKPPEPAHDYAWYFAEGERLRNRERSRPAIAAYDRAIALESKRAEPYSGKGFAYLDLGKTEEAQRMFARALKLNPRYAVAVMGMAVTSRQLGLKDEALRYYQQFLELQPSGPEAFAAKAEIQKLQSP